MVSTEIKKKIEQHLNLSYKLHIAANEVLENGLSVINVTTKYELDYPVLLRKVDIMKRKKEFYDKKRRLDAAIKEIIQGRSTYKAVSKHHGISACALYYEMRNARAQGNNEYDRKIAGNPVFTYLQEESLLKVLKDWARRESSQGHCSCTLCALEKLLILAYEFPQQNNIGCTLWDTFRQVSIDWLIDFEMRHTDEINLSFLSFVDIFKQIIA